MRRLADALGLREGEAGRTARLFGLILLMVLAIALAKAAQQGVFLAAAGRARIADAFILSAFSLAGASFLVSAVAARLGPARLFFVLVSLVAILLAAAWAALISTSLLDPMLLYVVVEVSVGLLMVQAWSVVSEVLDVRSAKRLLPLIGNAAGVGWTIGGFAVRPLAGWLGAPALLAIAAGLLVAAGALATAIARIDLGGRPAHGGRTTTLWQGARAGMGYVFGQPLLRALALLAILGLLMEQLLDFQLFAVAQQELGTDDRIASFMGAFFGVTGLISLFAPLITGQILSRFGSAPGAAAVAGVAAACSAAFVIHPSFALAVIARGGYRVLDNALGAPSRAQVQTAMPPVRRAQAGALLKGVLAPLFYAGGGFALKALPGDADLRLLSATSTALAVASVAVAWWYLRPAYLAALRQLLDRQRLQLDPEGRAADGERFKLLAGEIQTADAERARFAVAALEQAGPTARATLRAAAAHDSAEVRASAISALGRLGGSADDLPVMTAAVRAREPQVRLAALESLVGRGGSDAEAAALTAAEDNDPRVRALACAALVHALGGRDGGREAARWLAELDRMMSSGSAAERAAAAWAVGTAAMQDAGLRGGLLALVDDREPVVRVAAIRAAGRLGDPAMIAPLVGALEDRVTAEAAMQALADAGDRAVPAIERALIDGSDLAAMRVASALAATSGPGGDRLLAHMLASEHRLIRHRAARAIAARRRAGAGPPPRAAVVSAVRAELDIGHGYYLLLAGIARTDGVVDLEIEPAYRFIADEVEHRIRLTQRRLLALLALITDPRMIRVAEAQLLGGDPRRAAAALELLEHVVDRAIRRDVVGFLDRRSLRLRLRDVEHRRSLPHALVDDPLAGIMRSPDEHLKRCVLIGYGGEMAKEYPEEYARYEPELPLVQRMQFLRGVALFHELSGEDLMQVATIAEPVALAKGRHIFHKGDPSDEIYLVVTGKVAVRDGDTEIAVMSPPDVFGELAALDGEERSADAVCAVDTELLRIARPDLDELMERRPHVAREIIRVLAGRVRTATRKLVEQ